MTAGGSAFTIRSPGVVHDTIDGETLVINLETGSYYTLDGAAASAWQALAGGATQAELTEVVAGALGVDPDTAAAPVASLLTQLLDSGLVCPVPGGSAEVASPTADAVAALPGLALRSYDELQELLLIDPIHEVDDAGWPNRAPAST